MKKITLDWSNAGPKEAKWEVGPNILIEFSKSNSKFKTFSGARLRPLALKCMWESFASRDSETVVMPFSQVSQLPSSVMLLLLLVLVLPTSSHQNPITVPKHTAINVKVKQQRQ